MAVSSTPARVMIDARYIREQVSGIGRYTSHIIEQLLLLDDALELRLITHPANPQPVTHPRVSCETFDAPPNSLRTRLLLSSRVSFDGVDLFHSPFNILPAGLPVPAVFTLHDVMWLLDPAYCTDSAWRRAVLGRFYGALIPRAVDEAAQIMTVSHHSREAIEGQFPQARGRVHVTYNGLDQAFGPLSPEEAWPRLARWIRPRRPFVLVVGQGSPYKNHDGALEAFLEAYGDDPEVAFVLVRRFTRGPATRLHALMRRPELSGRVIHLPYVTGPQLHALYATARAFLFPSLYEGFGLPPLEAMACGTPVVTSDHGAMAEVCGAGAMQADPRDPVALGAALRAVVEDGPVREAMIARGFERAAQFTWRAGAAQALHTYRVALGLEPSQDTQ